MPFAGNVDHLERQWVAAADQRAYGWLGKLGSAIVCIADDAIGA